MISRLTIIGVGLIGGSIGIDVRKKKLAKEVVGVVRRPESVDECVRLGAVDKATLDARDGVKDADLVILATPISLMVQIAKDIKGYVNKETVVIDVASVKGRLVSQLEKVLGSNYIGTHPMAGSEKRGVTGATEGLFNGTVSIITPTQKTRPKFLKIVREFWNSLGAKTIVLSQNEHDKLVSLTSHLPHLIAASMVNNIKDEPKAIDCIGPGFRDSTRIAKSAPELWEEICEWNKKEILLSIDKFQKELSELKAHIEKDDWNDLLNKLQSAKDIRDKL